MNEMRGDDDWLRRSGKTKKEWGGLGESHLHSNTERIEKHKTISIETREHLC